MKNAKKTKTGSEHRNSLEVVHVFTSKKTYEEFFLFEWGLEGNKGVEKKKKQNR